MNKKIDNAADAVKEEEMNDMQRVRSIFEKRGATSIEVEFECSNDSMGDMTAVAYAMKGGKQEEVDIDADEERSVYEVVYANVEFYEASDGYYIGEKGTVCIEMDNGELSFTKSSSETYNETFTGKMEIELDEREIEFMRESVESISLDAYNGIEIDYKHDCVVPDGVIEKIVGAMSSLDYVSVIDSSDVDYYDEESYTVYWEESMGFGENGRVPVTVSCQAYVSR